MRGHADAETLAAFREELLPRRKARRLAAHLARCAQCAGLDAQLASLPALLAGAPAPAMPDALTTRIEAALAAEAAARSALAASGAPGPEAATAPSASPRGGAGGARGRREGRAAAPARSRIALRVAAVAAAVVVIAGGGYGISRVFSGGAPLATSSPAFAPAAGPAQRGPAAGRSHQAARINAASPGSKEHLALPSSPADLVIASRTNYQPGQLQAQVKAVLTRFSRVAAPHPGRIVTPASGLARLSRCVLRATGGRRARLVDQARYDGRPATVIVVPAGANTLRVLVAGTGCSGTATDLITSTTLPSPG